MLSGSVKLNQEQTLILRERITEGRSIHFDSFQAWLEELDRLIDGLIVVCVDAGRLKKYYDDGFGPASVVACACSLFE